MTTTTMRRDRKESECNKGIDNEEVKTTDFGKISILISFFYFSPEKIFLKSSCPKWLLASCGRVFFHGIFTPSFSSGWLALCALYSRHVSSWGRKKICCLQNFHKHYKVHELNNIKQL